MGAWRCGPQNYRLWAVIAPADHQAPELKHRWKSAQGLEKMEKMSIPNNLQQTKDSILTSLGKYSNMGNIDKIERMPLTNSSGEKNDHGMSV